MVSAQMPLHTGKERLFGMVSCTQCNTPNTLDSTFCKRCGASLGSEAIVEAQTRLDKLIEEGNALFAKGNLEEAMGVAELAVETNPNSIPALLLRTQCYERKGDIAMALECAERIVELNPDSELDRIKRNALRTRLQATVTPVDAPDTRLAFVGALATIILIASLGVFFARNFQKSDANLGSKLEGQVLTANQGSQTGRSGANPLVNPTAPEATTNLNPAGAVPNPNPQSNAGTPGPDDVPAVTSRRPTRSDDNQTVNLPKVGDQLPIPEGGAKPVEPFVPNGVAIRPVPTNEAAPKTNPEDPKPINLPKPVEPEAEKVVDPGEIDIRVHSGPQRRTSGGSESISGNGLETLQRVGSQQFTLGNYVGAAKSYEQAVRAGGDQIILNQRLGQAYDRLGRSGEAADAYRRCIAAVDREISAGRGNRQRLEQVKDVCQQAIKVLQGG